MGWHRAKVIVWLSALLLAAASLAQTPQAAAGAVAALQAKHAELQAKLRASAFGAPLVLTSQEADSRVGGDVWAEVDHSIEQVASTFKSPTTVCEFLFLHLNVHGCQPSKAGSGDVLTLVVGPKQTGGAGATYRMAYGLRIESASARYLRVALQADSGPLSTSDYLIVLEAVPLGNDRSFVHLGYAYSYGFMAKLAMEAYLATAGRSKIGFTVDGKDADGKPVHIRGERAALERNVIRYYLALLAYIGANDKPPQERTEARLRSWFALTERYAAQLHELDLDAYLQEKHADLARAAAETK
ncbi:MAG TPA: hypothetical protein VLE94_17835 [Burkholderiaceae bacterium]|nr:hypothetical protein [Burkholderiaceae bacterium]HSC01604.1 hypothetical protein [Burkholderiaceae bacterium]